MTEQVYARLSTLFADVCARSQTLYGGFLRVNAARNAASVQAVWGKPDFINHATIKYHSQYHVENLASKKEQAGASAESPFVHRGLFPSPWDATLTSVSPSRRIVVTLTLEKSKDEKSKKSEGVFNVFEDGRLVRSFHAPSTLHGMIYTGEREGGIAWSHDETKIAYVAETKLPDVPSFFENVNAKTDSKSDDKADVIPGTKYEYQDDWGELYVGKKTGSIFIATLATGKIDMVKGISRSLTCADVSFTPDDKGLLFAGTETAKPRRLGIVYCFNRPTTLFHYVFNADDSAKEGSVSELKIHAADEASRLIASTRSPRFSPDGKKLAFLATRDVVTHNTCSMLAIMDWETQNTTTVVDVIDEPEADYTKNSTTAFNGVYSGWLPKRCWSNDGAFIHFDTELGARLVWKIVDVATSKVYSPKYVEGDLVATETVIDRDGDWFLVSVSSPTSPASLYLTHVDLKTGKYHQPPICLEDQHGVAPHIGDWKVLSVPTSVAEKSTAQRKPIDEPELIKPHLLPLTESSSPFEAVVWIPSTEPPKDGFPVILDLHGGPHGNSGVGYRSMYQYLAALGFAIVNINYRGSVGYGIRPLESLVGRVGIQDVDDCHYGLLHVLETSGLPLNKNLVHCSGGSHGGFLVTHLVAQFPGFYRSTVARNPVTNIATQFYTSDIPDWGLAVAGVAHLDSICTTQKLQNDNNLVPQSPEVRAAIFHKLWQHSPMSNDLSKVTTPVLLGIGKVDRRVPHTQSLEFYDALKALHVEIRALQYPDDSHPLESLQAQGDVSVNWGAWVLEHNKL